MKRLTLVVLALLAIVAVGCAAVIDSEGAKVGDPKRFAEATHIAAMSEESVQATRIAVDIITTKQAAEISAQATTVSLQATRTANDISAVATREAIANAKRQSDADKVAAEATVALSKAKSEVEAQPSEARGKSVAYLLGWAGLGAGALVLVIGLAFGIVAWVNKRATVIYPNKQGQFPLLPEHGPGYTVYHDPNRALGPGTVINRPGIADRLTHVILLARGREKPQSPGATYPKTASESAMLQIGIGAQAVQDQVARQSGRPKVLFGILPIGAQTTQGQTRTRGRMPQISIINDPKQIKDFEQKLLSDGGDE